MKRADQTRDNNEGDIDYNDDEDDGGGGGGGGNGKRWGGGGRINSHKNRSTFV